METKAVLTNRYWLIFTVLLRPGATHRLLTHWHRLCMEKVLGYNFVSVEWEFIWHLCCVKQKLFSVITVICFSLNFAMPYSRRWNEKFTGDWVFFSLLKSFLSIWYKIWIWIFIFLVIEITNPTSHISLLYSISSS